MPVDAALVPRSGQVAARLGVRYGPARGLVVGGDVRVEELAIACAGQEAPFLRDQVVVIDLDELIVHDGA